MAVHVRKLKQDGLRQCNRRKIRARKRDDELAPLWADLKASILKINACNGGHTFKDRVDVKVYTAYRSDGSKWTPQ